LNSVITLISDYGAGSPYTAAMLGSALTLMPQTKVIELSHHIPPFDLVQAAFFLKSVYHQFPKGTCHLICLDTSISLHKKLLVVEANGHYFLGADNGIFSLLFDENLVQAYKIITNADAHLELFPEKNIFLPLLTKFFEQGSFEGLATRDQISPKKQSIQVTEDENGLRGTVMFIDGYSNAITNIHKSLFENTGKGRAFILYYWGKHTIEKLSANFEDSNAGDDIMLFNENQYLMLAINKGKGAQLLGLKPGSNIIIEFQEETDLI
jgi:S-adenosyl-L-methionine hydrolase (adenosine-forming)